MRQKWTANEIGNYLLQKHVKKVLLVCGKSFEKLSIYQYFTEFSKRSGVDVFTFWDYQPNPDYTSIVAGVDFFHKNHCDAIVAVGGGSSIDVAKCIKVFNNLDSGCNYLTQIIKGSEIPLVVAPTTAGTGSEATQFAVIYWNGEKQSISHESCYPDAVFFDAGILDSLPDYHKKASMLDALCHGIESYWCVNSNETSKRLADKSIRMIMKIIRNI